MAKRSGLDFALSDPTRIRICKTVAGAGRSSPRKLADELGIELGRVAYHVRVLAANDALKLVDEQPTRGSIRHVYEFAITESWALAVLGLDTNGDALEAPPG
jgi:Helix-turn-helix domain